MPAAFQAIAAKGRVILSARWFRISVQAAVYLFCMVFLARYLQESQAYLRDLEIDYVQIGLAFLSICCALFLGATGWWLTLRGLSVDCSHNDASRIFYRSNMAKYVPGYVWQYVGRAQMTRDLGAPNIVVAVSMTLEFLLLISAGFITVALFVPMVVIEQWSDRLPYSFGMIDATSLVLLLRVGALGCLFVVPIVVPQLLRIVKTIHVSFTALFAAIVAMQIGWMMTGVGLWFIYAAIQPAISTAQIPLFIFTMASAFLIGLAIFIVPGSIGVREGVMVLILAPYIQEASAVLVAVLSRVIYVFVDLLAGLTTYLWRK